MTRPTPGPSASALFRIDEVCERFEAAWQAGERPTLETHLAAVPASERAELFAWLLRTELECRLLRGERPTGDDYLPRFPDRADAIHAAFAAAGMALEVPAGTSGDRPTRLLDRTAARVVELPEQFGRYRILGPQSATGTAAAFLAYDTQVGRQVVLEVPRFGAAAVHPRLRFVRAARAAATVSHPNLCPILDTGEVQGVPFLTRPVLSGQLLAARVREGPLPPQQAVTLVEKLARGLQAAHQAGLLHRDLTPAAVLLTAASEPVLVDFGLACRTGDARLTLDGQVVGSPAYLAPERLRGEDATPTSDVYSLGVMLYELVTGELPFGRSPADLLPRPPHQAPPSPSAKCPEVPAALDAVCARAVAADPAQRYARMADLAEALGRLPWGEHSGTAGVRPADSPSKPIRRQPWGCASAGVAVVVLGGALLLAWLVAGPSAPPAAGESAAHKPRSLAGSFHRSAGAAGDRPERAGLTDR